MRAKLLKSYSIIKNVTYLVSNSYTSLHKCFFLRTCTVRFVLLMQEHRAFLFDTFLSISLNRYFKKLVKTVKHVIMRV